MRVSKFLPAKRLILSYVADWIAICVLAAVGAAFAVAEPNKRPFSLVDLSISYPYIPHAKIPTWLLVVVSVVAPAVIIFFVCLVLVPGPTISARTPRSLILRRKFWEWNTGWMGLGLSLALAFLFTQGMKNVFGKPRPDLIDRCQPDLSNIAAHAIEGIASNFNSEWVLVSASICTQTDNSILKDAWRSFPSGHASTSWSGLFYLALFLCSKFAISIPFLPPKKLSHEIPDGLDSYLGSQGTILPLHDHNSEELAGGRAKERAGFTAPSNIPPRNQAAAPPIYLLALPLIPIGTAIYISATRYYQFFHHGFDILSGLIIGVVSAWFAFRFYHLPLGQGAGWAWGARSRERAWAIGVGIPGYVGTEGWASKKGESDPQDPVLGPGFEQNRDERTEA